MSFRVLLCLLLSKFLFACADYGLSSQYPELKIKSAGPSQQYNWVGYTPHFPRTVPRPLLLYRWQPYEDPTYTAFWVSERENEVGEYRDVSGEIPHGFGEPKPSSLQAPLLDSFSGPSGPLGSYEDHGSIEPEVPIVDSYVEPNALGSLEDDYGFDGGYGKANIHEESYEIPSQIVEASPIIHSVDGDFGNQEGSYQEIAVGHQDSFIEAGQLVHAEQYAGESNFQPVTNVQEPIVPLVKPPHSEPLPLENEAALVSSELLQDTSSYQVLKRSPKQPVKELPIEVAKVSAEQKSSKEAQKSN